MAEENSRFVSPGIPHVLADRYELGELLGSGGMADVYEAFDRLLARRVAIKVLLSQYARDPSFRTRFKREAQSAASLSHPNIVAIYDTGVEGDTYFIVMEYVHGKTLRDVLHEAGGPLAPERAAEIAADVTLALAAAHARGIIHRDIKPGNIMLTEDGQVKVMDFGIARASSADSLTQTQAVVGTAQYIAPEQAQAQDVDARSDLYSLGCVLYEMLVGEVPFSGQTPVAIAFRQVREDPRPLHELNAAVPLGLEAVTLKAMAKNPANRYSTALEMRDDLLRSRSGLPVLATPLLAQAATQAVPRITSDANPTSLLGSVVAADQVTTGRDGAPGGGFGWWIAVLVLLALLLGAFLLARHLGQFQLGGSTPTTSTAAPTTVAPTTRPTTTSRHHAIASTTTGAPSTTPTTTTAPTTTVAPTTTGTSTTTAAPTTTVPTTTAAPTTTVPTTTAAPTTTSPATTAAPTTTAAGTTTAPPTTTSPAASSSALTTTTVGPTTSA